MSKLAHPTLLQEPILDFSSESKKLGKLFHHFPDGIPDFLVSGTLVKAKKGFANEVASVKQEKPRGRASCLVSVQQFLSSPNEGIGQPFLLGIELHRGIFGSPRLKGDNEQIILVILFS